MEEKLLGKISSAEFGICKDYPFLFGLHIGLSVGGNVGTIDKLWNLATSNHEEAATRMVDTVNDILKSAKVNYVSELVGIPVEVVMKYNLFMDFRILTEVL